MDSSVATTCLQGPSNAGEGSIQDGNSTSPSLPFDAVQQQRPVYTTAGTVWNPDSARPIRAPVRRGRASVGSTSGEQWLVVSQQDGTNTLNPLAASAVVPHYAPLQQNNDRAINPHAFYLAHRGDPSPIDMTSFPAGVGLLPIQASDTMLTQHNLRGDAAAAATANHGGEDDDDITDPADAFIEKLPMKSLVSLASYQNPYQQKAQHVLRVKSNPGPLPSGGVPAAPSSSYEAVGLSTSHQLRSLASTPSHVSSQTTQVDVRPLGDYTSTLPKTHANNQLALPRQSRPFPSSTLATGPGAPEPLKAGPPGQRQQGPSRIESTLASNLHAAGMSTAPPIRGIHSTQPLRPYLTQNMTNETDGLDMGGASRQVPITHCSHDGAGSSHDHPGLHAITRTATGERSESDISNRVITPPGFVRQSHIRSHGNSAQSARSGSDGVPVHQPGTYNFDPDQSGYITQSLPDRRFGFNDQALVQNARRFDLARQIMEARRAPALADSNEAPNISSHGPAKNWGNENLGSNILQQPSLVDGSPGSVPSQNGGYVQLSATAQVAAGLEPMPPTRNPCDWSENVEKLRPYDWDTARYHQPYHGQYPYGATKMDGQMLSERDARINAWFYSNTSRLGKTMGQALEERKHPKARPSPFGAIGDRRPKPEPEKKQTYAHISIEEANEMSTSEHAEPLLNLMFQAILDHKDTEKAREFDNTSERKANREVDCEDEEELRKLGSAALDPGSVPDTD